MIMVLGALMACLIPAVCSAQTAQEWQSTSTIQGSGSTYAPQVTAVGATAAPQQATTTTGTYSPAKAPSGPRRAEINLNNNDFLDGTDTNQSDQSPLGDAVLPLMLMAMSFCGIIYLRRQKASRR